MKRIAIYPGSFDPVTNGHLDIVRRGTVLFDEIIVAILHNPSKSALFTVEERLEMLQETMKDIPGVSFDTFGGLLVDYAHKRGAQAVLRGMRAVSDFEYEFQLALMNRKLNREVQSIFLMTDYKWFYTSSTIIKEAASLGGDISGLVPQTVNLRLKEKFRRLKNA